MHLDKQKTIHGDFVNHQTLFFLKLNRYHVAQKKFKIFGLAANHIRSRSTFSTFHCVRLPCILSAAWLQLQWVKPRLGLLTIHSLRLASGGGSPTYRHRSVCSCNAAVLRAGEWEVWWCVRERFREWGEGTAKRTGGQVDEGGRGRKKTCWDYSHYKMFAEIMVNNEQTEDPRLQTPDGNLSFCGRR